MSCRPRRQWLRQRPLMSWLWGSLLCVALTDAGRGLPVRKWRSHTAGTFLLRSSRTIQKECFFFQKSILQLKKFQYRWSAVNPVFVNIFCSHGIRISVAVQVVMFLFDRQRWQWSAAKKAKRFYFNLLIFYFFIDISNHLLDYTFVAEIPQRISQLQKPLLESPVQRLHAAGAELAMQNQCVLQNLNLKVKITTKIKIKIF